MATKTRDADATRATILATARAQFGAHGFERTTIRSVAAAAEVDPALVMHYFGSKANLFAEASRLEIPFPDLSDTPPDRIADALVPLLEQVWGSDGAFIPLLRAAATNKVAADTLLEVFVQQVAPALAAAAVDRPAERAALVGSQVLGIVLARNIVGVPPLVAMDTADLVQWLRPVFARYLAGPAPQ
ncbi:TetR family transcriptional regulator [Mycolicibacterium chitae]|uniref:TetR family transcriptional regulator n=1 Tax=Mycolicibacterium chitae TaxID=1792 RepID=A0A448I4T6_MYCCI|nr:TetR/AcrR family transcriptional regulator [Mycolicibacterium chitae]MCV7105261.1 TetR/AcrR family transcriptional regulator [Mycolicibacterium chitae]BBZ03886.1 TetR family transcriptional regulator [Mycolicibacterium chitae]VEG47537.1 TetR family transcriptional regulator [Mycolicibacterium chitae]